MCVSKNSQGINFSRPHAGVKNKLSVKLIRHSEASRCHPTPLETWGKHSSGCANDQPYPANFLTLRS